jgi:hypothetical protein
LFRNSSSKRFPIQKKKKFACWWRMWPDVWQLKNSKIIERFKFKLMCYATTFLRRSMKSNASPSVKVMLSIRGCPSIRGEYSQRQYQSNPK